MPRRRRRLPNVERVGERWRFDKTLHKGKPRELRLKSPAIFGSAEEAFDALQESLRAVNRYGPAAVAAARPIPTFAEMAEEWHSKVVEATCKRSTAYDYRLILDKLLLPHFGQYPVNAITKKMVRTWLLEMLQSRASSTVRHYQNAISGVLNLAVEDELIPANPAQALGRLGVKKPAKLVLPFAQEELQALLATFKKHWPLHYGLVAALALAGLRFGEAAALRPEDLNFHEGYILVRRSLSRMRMDTPKGAQERQVDMGASLAAILHGHLTLMKREALAQGWGGPPELVFTNSEGGPLDINHWRRRVWKKALAKAKVGGHRPHDLRHTFATLHLMHGAGLAWVSRQLGHHSEAFTLRQYSHWLPSEADKAQADRLADLAGVG